MACLCHMILFRKLILPLLGLCLLKWCRRGMKSNGLLHWYLSHVAAQGKKCAKDGRRKMLLPPLFFLFFLFNHLGLSQIQEQSTLNLLSFLLFHAFHYSSMSFYLFFNLFIPFAMMRYHRTCEHFEGKCLHRWRWLNQFIYYQNMFTAYFYAPYMSRQLNWFQYFFSTILFAFLHWLDLSAKCHYLNTFQ